MTTTDTDHLDVSRLSLLFTRLSGNSPAAVTRLAGAGSNRRYYRLTAADGTTVIGVAGTSCEENNAFVYLARHFASHGIRVPQVLAVSDDAMCYLQSDMGSRLLFDAVRSGREAGGHYDQHELTLLERTVRSLPQIQVTGARGLDFSHCYPQPAFDEEGVLFDLNYFKYCFLKTTGVDFHESRLERSFRAFAAELTHSGEGHFMYRDFQARNVMLDADDNPWFIDFQGGRRGPVYYDLVSFLWQASARYDDQLRQHLAAAYYEELKQLTDVPSPATFRDRLLAFALVRTLQVLGAYGFRGQFERKAHFLTSIPPAVDNLRQLLDDGACHDSYLNEVLRQLTCLPQYASRHDATSKDSTTAGDSHGKASASVYDNQGRLVVTVWSFSYRKGIPHDDSGNGGGYVFDCRATHNPGRYERYKTLTGLDLPVVQFLEDDGEILRFLDSVYRLADTHVERYISRGFTSLQFAFGCTGGQHRSVYSAQHLAEHINRKYGVEVRLCHREQGIRQTLAATRETQNP